VTAREGKLRPPALPVPYLPRPHLLDALSQGEIVCLMAAPGYGKSSVLAEYAAAGAGQIIWYSLDAADRDPAVLLAGLAGGFGAPALTGGSPTLGAHELSGWLEAEAVPRTAILDDVHLLDGSEPACRLLGELLAQRPATLRLILAGRFLPPIPGLARLRLAGCVRELTEADLAFSAAESRAVVDRLGARWEEHLHIRSGGWPAALRLLAETAAFDASGSAGLFDYLAEAVFRALAPADQQFLVTVSVLPVWRADACSRITEQAGAGEQLARLRQARLLVMAEPDGALRPHPLWLEFLRGRLRAQMPERYRELRRRAALYASEQGDPEAALEHALAAGDHGLIERLLVRTAHLLVRTGRLQRLEDWLSIIPEVVLESEPGVLAEAGEALRRAGQPSRAVRWLRAAVIGYARRRSDAMLTALSRLALAHADLGHWAEAEAAIEQVEAELGEAAGAARAEALLAVAEWEAGAGRAGAAVGGFRAAAALFAELGLRERQGAALFGLGAHGLVAAGRYQEALAELQQAAQRLEGAAACDALLSRFWLCAMLDRWVEAEQLLPALLPGSAHQQAHRYLAEALLAVHRGDHRAAEALGESAAICLHDAEPTPALAVLQALSRAWLELARRRPETGAREALRLAAAARVPLLIALAERLAAAAAGPDSTGAAGGLRAELLGTFRVSAGGQELGGDVWGRAQVRGLLQYLLVQPGFSAGREALLEAFWPGEPPETARAKLRVGLYRLKGVLTSAGCQLEADHDQITLHRASVGQVDVALLRAHLAAARGAGPESALSLALEGRSLYRGELLPQAYWPWVMPAREQVLREYRELLQLGLEAARQLGRTSSAAVILEEMLALEPGQEERERELMELLAQSGRRGEVLARYRRLARWLRSELGVEPEPQTRRLVRSLLS